MGDKLMKKIKKGKGIPPTNTKEDHEKSGVTIEKRTNDGLAKERFSLDEKKDNKA